MTIPTLRSPRTAAAGAVAAILATALLLPSLPAFATDTPTESDITTTSTTTVDAPVDVPVEAPVEVLPEEAPATDAPAEEPAIVEDTATDAPVEAPLEESGIAADEPAAPAAEAPVAAPAAPPAPVTAVEAPVSASPALLPAQTAIALTVTVTDPAGDPVPSYAALYDPQGVFVRETVTGTDGLAHFLYLPYGNYTMRVKPLSDGREDLLEEYWQNAADLASASYFTVAQPQVELAVQLDSAPSTAAGRLSGTVTEAGSGLPLAGAQVWLYRDSDHTDRIRYLTVGPDGRYDMGGIEPGEYAVTFWANGYTTLDYVDVTIGDAPVVLDRELEVQDDAQPTARGVILDYSGRTVPRAQVELWTAPGGDLVETVNADNGAWWATFDADVSFYPNPGTYYLRFVPPADSDVVAAWWPGTADAAQAVPVDFTEPGLQFFEVELPKDLTPPDPENDRYDVPADIAYVMSDPAAGILANDIGTPDFTVDEHSFAEHGEITIYDDGTFLYIPEPGFVGAEHITYSIIDGNGTRSASRGIIRLAVGDIDEAPPVARDDYYVLDQDSTLTVAADAGLLANDSGVAQLEIAGVLDENKAFGDHVGDLQVEDDGSFVFTPLPGVSGVFTIEYETFDGFRESARANLTFEIRGPVTHADGHPSGAARDDSALAHTGSSVPAPLLAIAALAVLAGAAILAQRLRPRIRPTAE